MKDEVENLESSQKEIADFFCEDPNTFKMEECFRLLNGFFDKFKKAVTENAKRREAEELAEQRRIQREIEEKKRLSIGGNIANTPSTGKKKRAWLFLFLFKQKKKVVIQIFLLLLFSLLNTTHDVV